VFEKTPGATVELVRASGGVFEITIDGALKFSKKALGRFPTDGEIVALAKG
jgi:selT/selW/selH-like putative selenoprotein